MHSTDLKHEFVTLRARGLALGKIAEQLNVPKSTLDRWQSDCEEEIQQLQRIEWEEIEEQYGYTLQDDLRRIMKRLRAAEDHLDARNLERFTRRELFQLIRESRREYEKKRALLLGTPKPDKMVRPPATTTTVSLEGGAPRRHDQSSDSLNPQRPTLNQTENPAKTLPFSCQNSGDHNSNLSPLPSVGPTLNSHPSTLNNPDLRNSGSGAIGNSNIHGYWNPPRGLNVPRAAAPSAGSSADALSVEAENPAFCPPFIHQKDGGSSTDLPLNLNPDPDPSKPSLETGTQPSTVNSQPPLDPFGLDGESIPINPYESTREWLERQGIKVSKTPEGARIIAAG